MIPGIQCQRASGLQIEQPEGRKERLNVNHYQDKDKKMAKIIPIYKIKNKFILPSMFIMVNTHCQIFLYKKYLEKLYLK